MVRHDAYEVCLVQLLEGLQDGRLTAMDPLHLSGVTKTCLLSIAGFEV